MNWIKKMFIHGDKSQGVDESEKIGDFTRSTSSLAVYGKIITNIDSKDSKTAQDEVAKRNCLAIIQRDLICDHTKTGVVEIDTIIHNVTVYQDSLVIIDRVFGTNYAYIKQSAKMFMAQSYKYRLLKKLECDIQLYSTKQEEIARTLEQFNSISKDDIMLKYYDSIIKRRDIREKAFKQIDQIISLEYNIDTGVKAFEMAYETYVKDRMPKEIRVNVVLLDGASTIGSKYKYYSFSDKYIERWNYKHTNNIENTSKTIDERSKLTPGLRYDILKRDGFKCVLCGRTAEDGVKLHVDHIKPISKGGLTIPENLRTLCQECNLGKSDKYDEVE